VRKLVVSDPDCDGFLEFAMHDSGDGVTILSDSRETGLGTDRFVLHMTAKGRVQLAQFLDGLGEVEK
jgi:hypothetical protein